MVRTILARHIIEHPLASRIIEVHINIRHRNAVGIQEAFKEEVKLNGVDIRNPKRISDRRTRRGPTTRPHPNPALLTRGTDVVVHNQEVAREAHRTDRIEFHLQPLSDFRRKWLAPALFRACPDERREIFRFKLNTNDLIIATQLLDTSVRIHPLQRFFIILLARIFLCAEAEWNVKARHNRVRVKVIFLNTLGDFEGVRNKLWILGEECLHILRRLEPLLPRVNHPSRIRQLASRRKREKDIVGVIVILIQEMDIIRRNDANIEFLAKFQHPLHDLALPLIEVGKAFAGTHRNVGSRLLSGMEHHLE